MAEEQNEVSLGRRPGIVERASYVIDLTRRIVANLFLLVILIALVVFLWRSGPPDVPESAALVIDPNGEIVEQLTGDSRQRALKRMLGQAEAETLVQDLLDAVEAAGQDERIKALFLDLNSMGGAGLSKLQRIGAAIQDFKTTGKKVVAASDFYFQPEYYLASMADEIYMHHMGLLLLDGYGRFRTYYKEGLDRLEVDWNVFRVGEYKSAVEPYLRQDMSPEAKEANLEWLGDLWQGYLEDVAAARRTTVESLGDKIDRFDELLRKANGDTAKAALEAGLVDHIVSRDRIRERMIELVGEDESTYSFNQIGYQDYLEAVGEETDDDSENLVGVVVAKGTILDGSQPPGNIGGDSTAALIRRARQDDHIKALVLRVDSGGGSAFASELIRRELELARDDGKPVVVSMGSVAASGGYWISTASDEIWASPNTITGSIGIFGMFPTFQRTLSKYLGVNVDGVGTTRFSGAVRPDRKLQPVVAEMFQLSVNHGYREFLTRVAEARGISVEDVDKIARGRVWSGRDAHELGLVDQLGGLEEAVESAAKLAQIEDDYSVKTIEKELKWSDQLLANLLNSVAECIAAGPETASRSLRWTVSGLLEREWKALSQFNDPGGIYAHCLCEVN